MITDNEEDKTMNRTVYANTVSRYIDQIKIDCFAVPAMINNEIHVCLVTPDTMVNVVASDSKLIEYGKNELYPRWGRILTPTVLIPVIRPFAKISTGIKTLNGVKAQEWELIVLSAIGGEYTGQDLLNVDIIHPVYGRIEIKKGRGKIGEYA